MHKLVIQIEPLDDWTELEERWPQFLRLVESMPGLQREATCRIDAFLYGDKPVALIHELYFETLEAAQQAMASPEGNAAGRLLQMMTNGRMALFFADHKEDDIENLRKYRPASDAESGSA